MTVEIRELIIQVEVTESSPSGASLPFTEHREWDEQRRVDRIKQEVLEQLLERGHQ
ncbi:DUF5908 family protein [Enterobacter ludwigii]|uniref:DUF5908 family protein n=1 Tax=Enterobacter ludwigii TaxID=299767 RepID=UPI003F7245A2